MHFLINIRSLAILAFMLVVFLWACNPAEKKKQNNAKPYVGQWAWEKSNDDNSFSIHIYQKGDSLIGTYCGSQEKGSKMDCAIDSTDVAFWFKKTNDQSVEFTFLSYKEDDKGRASLTIDGENLIWKTLQAPSTEHYAWDVAVMKRAKGNIPGISAK
ncbi:MAG: hypothetical protein ACOYOA_13480 [Saprospiraceae bacterium]